MNYLTSMPILSVFLSCFKAEKSTKKNYLGKFFVVIFSLTALILMGCEADESEQKDSSAPDAPVIHGIINGCPLTQIRVSQ